MKLTGPEKIIIQLLCDIHKKLAINGEMDADFISKAIMFDSWALNWRYGALFSNEDRSVDDPAVNEVGEILDMFTQLERSYEALSKEDLDTLKADGVTEYEVQFQGFDGNHDTHHGIAQFMIIELGRFENFKTRNLNSHFIMSLTHYRRMMTVYSRVRREAQPRYLFNKDEIATIAKAKTV